MFTLPKKYIRLFGYLAFSVAVVCSTLWVNINKHHLIQCLSKALTIRGDDQGIVRSNSVVMNIGIASCLHVGRLMRICPFRETLFEDKIIDGSAPLRTYIKKDMLGSEGYNWFGKSEYIFYDTIELHPGRRIVSTNEATDPADSLYAITKIRGHTKDCKNPLKTLCASIVPLTEDNLNNLKLISAFTVLFGEDAAEPRLDWNLDKSSVISSARFPSFITEKYWNTNRNPVPKSTLLVDNSGKFKIVQLADLHFSVGKGICRDEYPQQENCEADPKTLKFIEQVLDIEKPQFVVFTGDQIIGDECRQDSETAILKVVSPVIARGIPWTMVWGNHDDEGSLSRMELSDFIADLPFSIFTMSPYDTGDNKFGVGNQVHHVLDHDEKTKIALYFLDSHKYSSNAKVFPGYDWIKEAQWKYMEQYMKSDKSISRSKGVGELLSMAFFHIPLPEYTHLPQDSNNKRLVGSFKEGITAPKYNSGGIDTLHNLDVSVASVGHDHCNDYCLFDQSENGKIWLCYGGAAGEGGYAGYGGTERRIRIFEIDVLKRDIYSWKRLNGSPTEAFDYQKLVSDGVPYTV